MTVTSKERVRVEAGAKLDHEFELTAGELCLDFANTLTRPGHRESLTSYDALVAWSQQAALVAPREARLLRRGSVQTPRAAGAVLARALRLRELVFRLFAAVAAQRAVAPDDLDELTGLAAEASRHRRLALTADGVEWHWTRDAPGALDRMLWPIAQSAVELLTSEHLSSVRECAAPTCAWLFLDHSRNQTRRWCDMKVCGNRAKVRRFHQRTRER